MTHLQKIRKSKNITQAGLANASGLSLRAVQHYEQGDFCFGRVGVGTMLRLAAALGCNLSDLLDGDDKKAALAVESRNA